MDETYRIVLAATSKKADHDKLKKHFTEKNNPLNITQRMTLLQKIQSFEVTLAAKLTQEASNLRDMYAHESKRASELQKNGEDLWRRINDMEKDISLLENSSLTKRLLKAIRLITAKKETNLSRGEDNEK